MKRSFAICLAGTLLGVLAVLVLAQPARAQEPPLTTTVYLPAVQQFRITQPIAAGWAHTCAIRSGGVVRCWGGNGAGQLGDGTTSLSVRRVTALGLPAAYAVAASARQTCAATVGGVYCWGENYGRTPVPVAGIPPVVDLAVGYAVVSDGSVFDWGPGIPAARVEGVVNARQLVVGFGSASGSARCALTGGGTLRCWHYPAMDDAPEEFRGVFDWPGITGATAAAARGLPYVEEAAAYKVDLCVADAKGEVTCWHGACSNYDDCTTPAPPTDPAPWAQGTRRLIADRALCALRADGRVVCWGQFANGEGGLGSAYGDRAPVHGVHDAVAVAAGWAHACAYHRGGEVSCWGWNYSGQLGSKAALPGSDVPLRVPLDGIVSFAPGDSLSCALDAQAHIFCWGAHGGYTPVAFAAAGAAQAVTIQARSVSLGPSNIVSDPLVCTLAASRGIGCWEQDARAGDAPMVEIPGSAFAKGMAGSCFIGSDNRVRCWKLDNTGALTVARVEGHIPARSLAAGAGDSGCAVADGRVYCWKELFANASRGWEQVPDLTRVRQVAWARDHSCALGTGGRIRCWGENWYGQLGDGTTISSTTPVLVQGVEDAVAVAVDTYTSCALRADGQVLCWGAGRGATPVARFAVPGATGLALVGYEDLCAIADGTLWCAGDNRRGQLARNPGWTPVRVEGLDE
jgi:alpha-tubulin suppressor-like RCC1 family protein